MARKRKLKVGARALSLEERLAKSGGDIGGAERR